MHNPQEMGAELQTLEENFVKKNRNRFPIAILLTTLHIFRFRFSTEFFKILCNTSLERHFQQHITSPLIPKTSVGNPKKQTCCHDGKSRWLKTK
jgi:hypothetical protein